MECIEFPMAAKHSNYFSVKMLDLAETVGDFIGYWGFRKIHGRIWTLIYLSVEPMSTQDLIEALGFSKGLVSIAIKELCEFNLIVCVGKKNRGTQIYEANPDVLSVITSTLKSRELLMINKASSAIKSLPKHPNINGDRVKDLRELTEMAALMLKILTKPNLSSLSKWSKLINLKQPS